MTLVYLDALGEDNKCVQFSFYADFLDVLRKPEKIVRAVEKKFPNYAFGETTLVRNKCKEIKVGHVSV